MFKWRKEQEQEPMPDIANVPDDVKSLKQALILLSTKVERLEAKDQASTELRAVTNDRIQRLGEQIGEIRELFKVLSDEKKELDVRFSEYRALVDRVNPAAISTMLREFDKRVTLADGQIELMKKKQDSFTDRFQTFEKKLNYFKGEDALLEIQEQVKNDLRDVRALCMTANGHASQVENRYVKINEQVSSLSALVDELTQLRSDLLTLRDDLQSKKSLLESFRLDEKRLEESERLLGRMAQVIDDASRKLDSRITNVDIRLKMLERQKLGALASFIEKEQQASDKKVEHMKRLIEKKTSAGQQAAPAQQNNEPSQ